MERKGAYYTEALGEKVAAAARPDKISTIYVIYSTISRTWSVVPQGRMRALRVLRNKSEAISFARKTALRLSADYIVLDGNKDEGSKEIPVHKK